MLNGIMNQLLKFFKGIMMANNIISNQLNFLIQKEVIYVYIYEYIDSMCFLRESNLKVDSLEYKIIYNNFINAGWNGKGTLSEIWIPPFAINAILNEDIDEGYSLIKNWSSGFILWHVKQEEDGLSFIGSIKKLVIPDFGLEL